MLINDSQLTLTHFLEHRYFIIASPQNIHPPEHIQIPLGRHHLIDPKNNIPQQINLPQGTNLRKRQPAQHYYDELLFVELGGGVVGDGGT